jgi:hypothetical protein
MSDEPFYTPGKKPTPQPHYRPKTTERIWELRKDHVTWSADLRFHGESYSWEAMILRDGDWRGPNGSCSRQKARDLLRDREGDISKGVPVSSVMGRYKFEDARTDIENEYAVNGRKSIEELKRRIKLHLEPVFRGRRMASITTADVRAFTKDRIDAKASAGEINRELAILKRMFTLAIKGNRLMVRPHIPMLQEHHVRTGFFERDEFLTVRGHLPAALQPVATFGS